MNLPQLHSKRPKLHFKRLNAITVAGLILAAVVLVVVFSGAQTAVGTSELFQDELRIQLGSNGFTPAEVQHAAGTFGIIVENSDFR